MHILLLRTTCHALHNVRERLGGALPSAESSVPARPPLLDTVENVEAPQPPGRMALRQHANGAAFPSRSRGERALLHGRGEASLTDLSVICAASPGPLEGGRTEPVPKASAATD